MKNNSFIDLTYIISLQEKFPIDRFIKEVKLALAGVTDNISYESPEEKTIPHTVETASLPGSRFIQLFIRISGHKLRIEHGGFPRLISIIFGNPFRNAAIHSATLTKISLADRLVRYFKGPHLGIKGIEKIVKSENLPLLSVPVPRCTSEEQYKQMIEALLMEGVQCFYHSLLNEANINDFQNKIKILSSLSSKKRPVLYFIDATIEIPILNSYIKEIKNATIPKTLTIGVRVCPLSVGLGICSSIRRLEIPIFGYNLLHQIVTSGGKFSITNGALAKIFRIVGCDLVNVGLRAKDMIGKRNAIEIIDSLVSNGETNLKQSFPVFTGTITPRNANVIIRDYGKRLVLHTSRPIFHGETEPKKISRNVRALKEAIKLANQGLSVEKAIEKENSRTESIRKYEKKYGTDL